MPTHWTHWLQFTWQAHMPRQLGAPRVHRPLLRTVSQRTEVLPPERLYRASRWRGGLRDWLNTGWDVSRPAPLEALPSRAASRETTPSATDELRRAFIEMNRKPSSAWRR